MTLRKDPKNNLEYFDAVVDGYKNFDKKRRIYICKIMKFYVLNALRLKQGV